MHGFSTFFCILLIFCSCFGDVSVPAAACLHKLHSFIENHALAGEREWLSHVAPSGPSRWQPVPVIEHLKMKAKVCDASICIALIIS